MSDADADGDSQMRSSSSEGNESEPLFPTANDPTITIGHPPATTFTSELSPPTSQDPPDQNGYEGFQDEPMDLEPPQAPIDNAAATKELGYSEEFFSSGGGGGDGSSSTVRFGEGEDYGRSPEEAQEPGYAWMCKKARDEYQKAMEYVVDKNFSLREYGDPFDERIEARETSPSKENPN